MGKSGRDNYRVREVTLMNREMLLSQKRLQRPQLLAIRREEQLP